jgi:hypothetical protein
VLFDGKDHELLENLVSHYELLGGSRDVSVVVEDSHTSESGDLDLHGDVPLEVSVDFGLLAGVDSGVESRACLVEAFVSDFVNHLLILLLIVRLNKYISQVISIELFRISFLIDL